jgi:hypothetical protein
MSEGSLMEAIKSAIADGNHEEARTLLRVALKEPTAEIYYLASQVALNEQQRQSFLKRAEGIKKLHTHTVRDDKSVISKTLDSFQEFRSEHTKYLEPKTQPVIKQKSVHAKLKRAWVIGVVGFVVSFIVVVVGGVRDFDEFLQDFLPNFSGSLLIGAILYLLGRLIWKNDTK